MTQGKTRCKQRIHVNQHVIRANKKDGARNPVLTVKSSKANVLTNDVQIIADDGTVVARVIYSPDKPLDCGATVWVETELEVRTS